MKKLQFTVDQLRRAMSGTMDLYDEYKSTVTNETAKDYAIDDLIESVEVGKEFEDLGETNGDHDPICQVVSNDSNTS